VFGSWCLVFEYRDLAFRLVGPLSVSLEIVASRDDFSERGCVRSTSRSMSKRPEILVSLQPFVPSLPAAAGPADTAALLWLRLRRAAEVCDGSYRAKLPMKALRLSTISQVRFSPLPWNDASSV